ncbi:MAG: D-aminoacyl-tRNA deacylase [Proteobacteria bacterium]|nr:D-aminoacyl-tRNA deacylase [Pseudomonadota bacterium]
MRAVVQRVREARVDVGAESVAGIGPGMLALVGVARGDGEAEARWMAAKLVGLRIFPDDAGRMNRSLVEAGGELCVVSQFTLLGDARKGRRPSFVGAAAPEMAEPLVARVGELAAEAGVRVATGRFGAHMSVSLVNDGPVTLVLDSPAAADAAS